MENITMRIMKGTKDIIMRREMQSQAIQEVDMEDMDVVDTEEVMGMEVMVATMERDLLNLVIDMEDIALMVDMVGVIVAIEEDMVEDIMEKEMLKQDMVDMVMVEGMDLAMVVAMEVIQ